MDRGRPARGMTKIRWAPARGDVGANWAGGTPAVPVREIGDAEDLLSLAAFQSRGSDKNSGEDDSSGNDQCVTERCDLHNSAAPREKRNQPNYETPDTQRQ